MITRPLNAVIENQPYLRNGKGYTSFRRIVNGWSTTTRITDMRGDLKIRL